MTIVPKTIEDQLFHLWPESGEPSPLFPSRLRDDEADLRTCFRSTKNAFLHEERGEIDHSGMDEAVAYLPLLFRLEH